MMGNRKITKLTTNRSIRFLFVFFLIALFSTRLYPLSEKKEEAGVEVSGAIDAGKYFDKELFAKGEAEAKEFEVNKRVLGAVIPHHMPASSLLSGLFRGLSKNNYNTVYIIGPNHEELGEDFAVTGNSTYITEFGELQSDADSIKELINSGEVKSNNGVIEVEHSLLIPMNYISKYFPDSKVIIIALKETNDINRIIKLADVIEGNLKDNDLLLASVDFSHNLDALSAENKDKETIEALKQGNYGKINSFGSDNLDSSSSIILLDMLMKKRGAKFNLLVNSDSSDFTGYSKDVTSYILGVYIT